MSTNNHNAKAWVLYDADCRVCASLARRFEKLLAHRGFELLPLQTPWVREKLSVSNTDMLAEMRLMFPDGKSVGGADAVLCLARQIWWAWPLWAISRLPGVTLILNLTYRRLATHRHCFNGACKIHQHKGHHGLTAFFEMP